MIRMGVDLGERRVGMAICDALEIIASPLYSKKIGNGNEALACVVAVAEEQKAEEIVVGLPLHMSGRRGTKAKEAEAFAEKLRSLGWRVALYDERLTTVEAERGLREQDMNRRRRKNLIDAHAAQRLLQAYLERLAAIRRREEERKEQS